MANKEYYEEDQVIVHITNMVFTGFCVLLVAISVWVATCQ